MTLGYMWSFLSLVSGQAGGWQWRPGSSEKEIQALNNMRIVRKLPQNKSVCGAKTEEDRNTDVHTWKPGLGGGSKSQTKP